jgi:hypothetical protein
LSISTWRRTRASAAQHARMIEESPLRHYILDGHTPMAANLEQYLEWVHARNGRAQHVAKTDIYPGGPNDGHIHVSTVFLNIDHGWGGGPPVLFETMIFPTGAQWEQWNLLLPDDDLNPNGDATLTDYQDRYTNWEDAEAGHKRAVALVHEALSRYEGAKEVAE